MSKDLSDVVGSLWRRTLQSMHERLLKGLRDATMLDLEAAATTAAAAAAESTAIKSKSKSKAKAAAGTAFSSGGKVPAVEGLPSGRLQHEPSTLNPNHMPTLRLPYDYPIPTLFLPYAYPMPRPCIIMQTFIWVKSDPKTYPKPYLKTPALIRTNCQVRLASSCGHAGPRGETCSCSGKRTRIATRHDTTRHDTARHGTARHSTARHGTERNETKRNQTKSNETKRNLECNSILVECFLPRRTRLTLCALNPPYHQFVKPTSHRPNVPSFQAPRANIPDVGLPPRCDDPCAASPCPVPRPGASPHGGRVGGRAAVCGDAFGIL